MALELQLDSDFAKMCDRARSRSLREVLDSGRRMEDMEADLGLSEADLPETYENDKQGPQASLHLKSGVVTISPPPGGWQSTLDIWRATEALSYALRAHALPPQRKGPPLVLTWPPTGYTSPLTT